MQTWMWLGIGMLTVGWVWYRWVGGYLFGWLIMLAMRPSEGVCWRPRKNLRKREK